MKEKADKDAVCPFCGFDPKMYEQRSFVLPPFTVLNGKYLVGQVLGAGGFGITYAAFDLRMERRVAIKEFYMRGGMYRKTTASTNVDYTVDDIDQEKMVKASMAKFEAEAKILARLDNLPGIVTAYDIFNENNTVYITLEYLDGVTLKQYTEQSGGRLGTEDVLRRLEPVMRSLETLHQENILHRDISPDNIMVMDNDVKLFDFGGARAVTGQENYRSSLMLQKAGFSPIEQVSNGEQGPWTDVYALAATIYYCITGTVPPDCISRVMGREMLQKPSVLGADISADREQVLLKALAVDSRDRYQNVGDFRRDLYRENAPAADASHRNDIRDTRANTPGGAHADTHVNVHGDGHANAPGDGRANAYANSRGGARADTPSASSGYAGRPPKKSRIGLFVALWVAAVLFFVIGGIRIMSRVLKDRGNNNPGSEVSVSEGSVLEAAAASEASSESQAVGTSEAATASQASAASEVASASEAAAASEVAAASQAGTVSEAATASQAATVSEAATASQAATASEAASASQTSPASGTTSSGYPTPDGVSLKAASSNKAAPDWTEYTDLITQIRSTIPAEERLAKMHRAEDILMETGAVIPLFYYNDLYLQKTDVEGIYADPYNFKHFRDAKCPRGVLRAGMFYYADQYSDLSLDPALSYEPEIQTLVCNLFTGLFTYNAEGQTEPACAESYDVSEDGLTYTFYLRDGLKWSTGDALTAKDFEFAWKRAAGDETAADYGYLLTGILAMNGDGDVDVTAADDRTLQVRLAKPCPFFCSLTAYPVFYPVPAAFVEKNGEISDPGKWAEEPRFPTNGPYTVTRWEFGRTIVLKKNEAWYNAGSVEAAEVEVMIRDVEEELYSKYRDGDLDFLDSVPTDRVPEVKDSDELRVLDSLGTYFAVFNVNSSLFDGKTVQQAADIRKAVSLLIDREYIADSVGQTLQKPATSFIPAGMADGCGGIFKMNTDSYAYPVKESAGYYPEKCTESAVDEAVELLEGAGCRFEDGRLSAATPLSIRYLTNESEGNIAIAEVIQADLAQVGISMEIQTCDWSEFLEKRRNGEFDLTRDGWVADYDDPVNMLEMWMPESGSDDCRLGMQK